MKTYIAKLREEAAAAEANRMHAAAQSKRQGADTRVLCDVSLTDQITSFMRTLPPAQRNRPWSMQELVLRLQGRYSARPHAMQVGESLRALGWTQRRDWTRNGGGRRYWHPVSK